MAETDIKLTVNGTEHTVAVEPRTLLIHLLREHLGLTGPHIGCETSHCGACTVDLNGKSVKSCTVFAAQADGGEVLTVEGLASNGTLHPLQEAFIQNDAVQCGFCTPGMLMASRALLERNPSPSRDQIARALGSNMCRCTGYISIIDARNNARESSEPPSRDS